MSLVSSEGEGEQNEIRILQDKLSATMKLVSHLTAQLSELKEQVRPRPGPCWQPPLCLRPQPACLGVGRVVGPFCFLCPLPAGPSSWVWGGGPFGELDGGETRGRRPLPHAPEGSPAGWSTTSCRCGASLLRPLTPNLQLLDSGPGPDG